jgi:hypothetical protein
MNNSDWENIKYLIYHRKPESIELFFSEQFCNINTKVDLEKLMDSSEWKHYKKCMKKLNIEDMKKIYYIFKNKNKNSIVLKNNISFVENTLNSCHQNENKNKKILK